MSEFVRSRFFFIIVMISLSIAQGLVFHIGQRTSAKFEQSLPTTVSSSLLKTFP